ncbi:M15 family metallopeptidase [Agarilytica rhodophyticola]|uniref:M15 family metallopeptidase n=1 Tax=Agarilytica rhodophyticola TaxID=1737490 RepID=UPI001FEA898D|nr:M15 family metallopeptidase [Agarilytica rhodophyticola]
MDKHSKKNVIRNAVIGKDCTLIDSKSCEKPIHFELVSALRELQAQAEKNGFDLRIASGYRSFEQQLQIWNAKASGLRDVLDKNENALDITQLNPKELMFAILRWSALPGTSRHHWGTDFDVYDAAAIDDGYQLQLTVSETQKGGPFEAFYCWLDNILSQPAMSFFRPYTLNSQLEVAPEPWHLSYRPTAHLFQQELTIELVSDVIKNSEIALKTVILDNLEEIFQRFVVTSS